MTKTKLPGEISSDVARTLMEDIGSGDVTASLIPAHAQAKAQVITREDAVLCGMAWFDEVFRQVDRSVQITWKAKDGDVVKTGQTLCHLIGSARSLLTGERTALNFLQLLSGTATRTRAYVDAVRGTNAIILDTRKTIPGLRHAQKYAVTCGGGQNHRMGLYDAILIKENHIAVAGSVAAALRAAHENATPGVTIEMEVENINQLREALAAGAKRLLLDNFSLNELAKAVQETQGRAKLEASGGVTLDNIRAIATTGVDYISIGDLTKNVQAVDLSMRFDGQQKT
jgi:nicotinate-nucleotide pyrophosphorylase (carboxylating)